MAGAKEWGTLRVVGKYLRDISEVAARIDQEWYGGPSWFSEVVEWSEPVIDMNTVTWLYSPRHALGLKELELFRSSDTVWSSPTVDIYDGGRLSVFVLLVDCYYGPDLRQFTGP